MKELAEGRRERWAVISRDEPGRRLVREMKCRAARRANDA